KLIQGMKIGQPQEPIYWDHRNADAKPHEGGKFEFDITFPRPAYAARVEADGYLPADSRVFTDSEANVALEFKLKKGMALAGVIRVGAAPKAGPTITVSHIDTTPADPAAPRVYHDLQAMTDKDGRFTFNRVPAGRASVSLQVKLTERTTSYTQTQQIDVTAG